MFHGAQIGDGCETVRVSRQSIVKETGASSVLVDFTGVRPALL
ncbi:hypothetical protein [Streptomyces achromogenes]